MKEILDKKELLDIIEILNKTFKTLDPFGSKGEIFYNKFTDKLIIYPVEGYKLDEKQFYALISTCKSFGESKVYFSEFEGYNLTELRELKGKYINHYYEMEVLDRSIDNMYKEYLKMELIVENAIYSECGYFGILFSHEEHAVLGGKREFIDIFKSKYSEWIYSRQKFKDTWEEYSKRNTIVESWYWNLVKYIYEGNI